jgi:hypothetical protein
MGLVERYKKLLAQFLKIRACADDTKTVLRFGFQLNPQIGDATSARIQMLLQPCKKCKRETARQKTFTPSFHQAATIRSQ